MLRRPAVHIKATNRPVRLNTLTIVPAQPGYWTLTLAFGIDYQAYALRTPVVAWDIAMRNGTTFARPITVDPHRNSPFVLSPGLRVTDTEGGGSWDTEQQWLSAICAKKRPPARKTR